MKPEAYHISKSTLEVHTASLHTSTVRLECDDSVSAVLHIFDGKQTVTLRVGGTTLTCLAKVFEIWTNERSHSEKDPAK